MEEMEFTSTEVGNAAISQATLYSSEPYNFQVNKEEDKGDLIKCSETTEEGVTATHNNGPIVLDGRVEKVLPKTKKFPGGHGESENGGQETAGSGVDAQGEGGAEGEEPEGGGVNERGEGGGEGVTCAAVEEKNILGKMKFVSGVKLPLPKSILTEMEYLKK